MLEVMASNKLSTVSWYNVTSFPSVHSTEDHKQALHDDPRLNHTKADHFATKSPLRIVRWHFYAQAAILLTLLARREVAMQASGHSRVIS